MEEIHYYFQVVKSSQKSFPLFPLRLLLQGHCTMRAAGR